MGRRALLGVVVGVAALASAPAALATTPVYTWDGASVLSDLWTTAGDWQAGSVPPANAGASVGDLNFPDIPACDVESAPFACYRSVEGDQSPGGGNKVIEGYYGFTANQLSIDDARAYALSPQDVLASVTLDGSPTANGNVGLIATPDPNTTSKPAALGTPMITIPINLANSQSWQIDGGGTGAHYGLVVPTISGLDGMGLTSSALGLSFTNGGRLTTNSLTTSLVAVSGPGTLVAASAPGAAAVLPGGGILLSSGGSITVQSPGTTSGSLGTASSSSSAQPQITVGNGSAPDATWTVSGGVRLDQWTHLSFELDQTGSTPSDDFSQLNATGGVNLAGATITLGQGWSSATGGCSTLRIGSSFPILTATGGISGTLTYTDAAGTQQTLAPGQTSSPLPVTLLNHCSTGSPAQTALATLSYGSDAITASIVGAPVATLYPSISGTPAVGQTLKLDSVGSWIGYPSPTYAYQWLSCRAGNCTPISGATGTSLTLTSAELGAEIELQVTAGNSQGSATVTSSPAGPVVAAGTGGSTNGGNSSGGVSPAQTGLTRSQISRALRGLSHPAGNGAIGALIRTGSYLAHFSSPSGGSVMIVWTTRITTGTGRHRRHHTLIVARGSARTAGPAHLPLRVRLTAAGRRLLKRHPHNLHITALERFRPTGGAWVTYSRRFTL